MSSHKKLTYLPHLDGLRAVALLGVLLFHFEVSHFEGGFVGVDVFLTLSGYLITRNLLNDASNNVFSLRSFYIRRFFRLYPASSVAVLFTITLAYLFFSPTLTFEVCQSALASQFFSSNFFFYSKANYFEKKSLDRPLLHTWSLSLEEQFYFLWAPFLSMVLTIRKIKLQIVIIATVTLCSFSYACFINSRNYSLAFYMIPSRAYQFTLGALLAFFQRLPSRNSFNTPQDAKVRKSASKKWDPEGGYETNDEKSFPKLQSETSFVNRKASKFSFWVTNTLAFLSLFTLFLSYMMLPKSPSPYLTLPATFATAAIIHTESSILSRMLSSRLTVFIGSLTYCAYLIHWPVWVYARYLLLILDVDGRWKPNPIAVVAITFLIAILVRHYVEQPFRKGNRRAQVSVALLFVITVGTAAYGVQTFGFWFRLRGKENNFGMMRRNLTERGLPVFALDACQDLNYFITDGNKETKISCLTGSKSGPSLDNFVVIGNSFASMLLPTLDTIGRKRSIRIPVWFGYRCPLRARERLHVVEDMGVFTCKRTVSAMWDRIEEMPRNSTVLFSLYWGFDSAEHACDELGEIDKELDKLGLNAGIFPEPPGAHPRYDRFYNCVDSLKLPIAPFLKWWGRQQKWESMSSCGPDIHEGLEPDAMFSQLEERYHSCSNLKRMKVLSLSEKICKNVTENDSFRWLETPKRCAFPNSSVVPPGIDDLGYERGLFHLSTYGAYRLESILEEFIAPYLP